jgi:hypothetical protein
LASPKAHGMQVVRERRIGRVYCVTVGFAWVATVVVLVGLNHWSLGAPLGTILAWTFVTALANLPKVGDPTPARLTADIPLLLAAALVLGPIPCIVIAFVGAFDTREFRREIGWQKALFNRVEVSLATGVQAWIAQPLLSGHAHSIAIMPIGLLVLLVGLVVNYATVGVALSLLYGFRLRDSMLRMRMGRWFDYAITIGSWGILAVMFVALYDLLSISALPFFLLPVL